MVNAPYQQETFEAPPKLEKHSNCLQLNGDATTLVMAMIMNTITIIMFAFLGLCFVNVVLLAYSYKTSNVKDLRKGWIDVDGSLNYGGSPHKGGGSLDVKEIPQDVLTYFLKKEATYLDHCKQYPEDWCAEGELPYKSLCKEAVARAMETFRLTRYKR